MKKFLFIFSFLLSINCFASFVDGNELHKKINSNESIEKFYAYGYILGITDSFIEVCSKKSKNNTLYNIQAGQLFDSVKIYLANNPNIRNFSAKSIILDVLKKDYNCIF